MLLAPRGRVVFTGFPVEVVHQPRDAARAAKR